MPHKLRFIISVSLILLLSWADVYYAGTSAVTILSRNQKLAVHVLMIVITMLTGYYNWRDYHEKWLLRLWLLLYLLIICLLSAVAVLIMTGYPPGVQITAIVAHIRNVSASPLLLLVFYIVAVSVKRILEQGPL